MTHSCHQCRFFEAGEVDPEMGRPEEVFLPYIQVAPDKTMYQAIAERGFTKALPEGKP